LRRTEIVVRLLSYGETLVILLGVPFWIISIGCVYLGWAIATRQVLPDFWILLGMLVTSVFISGSTFAYNDYADRDIDRMNMRKKGSLLVWGMLRPRLVLGLAAALALAGILVSLLINLSFGALMGACLLLSLLYSNPHIKLKSRGGWDLAVNMLGIGVILPLAGWSVARPVQQFPVFYLPSIAFGIGTLYILTTLADRRIDRASGINTVVVRLGKTASIRLGFVLLVLDTLSLVAIGWLNYLVPWRIMRLLWPPLVVQWLIYYHFIMRGRATYGNIIYAIIALAGIFIGATGLFLLFFSGVLPVP